MSANYGEHFRLTIFGESHGPAIGIVLDGMPAGFMIDMEEVRMHMARRAPGRDRSATKRKEADQPQILSGVYRGRTTGAPLAAIIANSGAHSSDYEELSHIMRPGHADYAGYVRYHGYNDPRGGGHFSGRLTAPIVFAGSIARQFLAREGIVIGAHIASIATIRDGRFDPIHVDAAVLKSLWSKRFPLLVEVLEADMRSCIETAQKDGDSVGGVIECAAVGLPAGIGSPFFGSVESVFSQLAFSVPAVKSVEFGDGTAIANLRGSEANDPLYFKNGRIMCTSNHNGGVTGGITNGMPLLASVAIKPTPSIALPQHTVDIGTGQETILRISGRHDPCIVPRAVPVIESVMALALLDLMMDMRASA